MSNIKKAFVYMIEPNKIMLFSIISSFVGYSYMGRDDSSSYIFIMATVFLISFAFYVNEILKRPQVRSDGFIITAIWIFWLSINLILFVTQFGWDYSYTKYYIFFFVFSFNSLLWGMRFGRDYELNIHTMIKWFEPIALIISVYSIIYVLVPFGSSDATIRRAAYQSNSYYAAFAFGMTLFYFVSNKRYERFKLFYSPFIKALYVLFLILLPLSVISTGGRGGFVLFLVYGIITIYYVFFSDHSVNTKKVFMAIGAIIGFVALIVILVSVVSKSIDLQNSFSLTISYLDLSSGRIDMSATSNRDIVYSQALGMIKERPILGYGLFSYMPKLTTTYSYPHQLFLEFLLQGGIIYTIFAAAIIVYVFVKLRRLERFDSSSYYIVYLFAYPFTMLMFSGTYLTTSLFWFCISAILSARYKNEDN